MVLLIFLETIVLQATCCWHDDGELVRRLPWCRSNLSEMSPWQGGTSLGFMNYRPDGDRKNNELPKSMPKPPTGTGTPIHEDHLNSPNPCPNHPQEPAHQYTKITWTPQIHAQTTHMNRRTNTRRSPEPPKSILVYQSVWNFKIVLWPPIFTLLLHLLNILWPCSTWPKVLAQDFYW